VLAANADAAVLRRYDAELDAAYEQARDDGDLTALMQTVRRWWFEADAWRDPEAQREFLARFDRYQREAPPPRNAAAEKKYARSTAPEAVYRWELDDSAQPAFDALGSVTQGAADSFYGCGSYCRSDRLSTPCRRTFRSARALTHPTFRPTSRGSRDIPGIPQDELVLVVRIQWLGD
jgi:hypothetical protein